MIMESLLAEEQASSGEDDDRLEDEDEMENDDFPENEEEDDEEDGIKRTDAQIVQRSIRSRRKSSRLDDAIMYLTQLCLNFMTNLSSTIFDFS